MHTGRQVIEGPKDMGHLLNLDNTQAPTHTGGRRVGILETLETIDVLL